MERKTCEPIALEAGLPREPIQFVVGAGEWDDEAVTTELRQDVRGQLAESEGVVVIDPTPAGSPRRGPSRVASAVSGAVGWARSTMARSVSSWPTPR